MGNASASYNITTTAKMMLLVCLLAAGFYSYSTPVFAGVGWMCYFVGSMLVSNNLYIFYFEF